MIQEMMGREMKIKSGTNSITRVVVDQVEKDDIYSLLVSADSLEVFSSTPMGDTTIVMNDVVGKRTRINMSKLGNILVRETIDTVKMMGRFSSGAQREGIKFPILFEKSLKIGETWNSKTIDTIKQMGGNIAVNSDYTYTLVGKEKINGSECLSVTFTGKYTLEGKTSRQGLEFYLDGSGKNNGKFYFDPKLGLVVEEETNSESEINLATTGEQQMIIPISQTTKSIKKLIK